MLADALDAAAGMSQREIARAVNRSQPEVAHLVCFFPASERGGVLAKRRRAVDRDLDDVDTGLRAVVSDAPPHLESRDVLPRGGQHFESRQRWLSQFSHGTHLDR